MSKTNKSGCGCGTIILIIFIVFIILKMTDLIAWSWLWVFSPFFIYLIFPIILILLMVGAIIIPRATQHQGFLKDQDDE
jgi:hypothetical protein